MSIKEILIAIFARIDVKHKWQQDFLLELFELVYSIQGRLTFENMARYSKFNESTFRRNFKKVFDWLGFNWQLLDWGGLDFSNPVNRSFSDSIAETDLRSFIGRGVCGNRK